MTDSDRIEAGDEVVAIGRPKRLNQFRQQRHSQPIAGTGEADTKSSSTPLPIRRAAAGGLFNRRGQVIGLNTFSLQEANSLFFSVPVNYVRAAIDSSDGKWISLDQFAAAIAKQDKEREQAELQVYLNKNFVRHQDAAGLFSAQVPRDWQSERTEFANGENAGTRHVITIFRAPSAERAEITGRLSAGIRVHLRFPAKAQTWGSGGAAWVDRQV